MSLEAWAREYGRDLLGWAIKQVQDRATAEDLVQETLLAAAERVESFQGGSHPRTWLIGILKNKIADHLRARVRSRQVVTGDLGADFDEQGHWKRGQGPMPWSESEPHLLDNEAFVRVFHECLSKLPPAWHACLVLKFLEHRDTDDICQELGLTTTNYWQIQHRAKLQLRRCLDAHWFRPEDT